MSELDTYYLKLEEPNRSCLLALRNIILKQDSHVNEMRKWGMPCFCFGKKMFCFLMMDKKTQQPYMLMVEGNHLPHPYLEQGKRTRMKVFNIDPNKDLPLDTIIGLINDALDLYRNGILKSKSRP